MLHRIIQQWAGLSGQIILFNNQIMNKSKEKKSVKKEKEIPIKQICQVCKTSLPDSDKSPQKLKCKDCERSVHKYCYAPDCKDKDKFRCDPCRKKATNKNTPVCSLCGREGDMLKEVGSGEWMHVFCALTSTRTKLSSYRSLTFTAEGTANKKVAGPKKCEICGYARGEGLPCRVKDCRKHLHLNCVIEGMSNANDQNFAHFASVGLLDKNQDSLLVQLRTAGVRAGLLGLELYRQEREEVRQVVCGDHNVESSFVWCTCGKEAEDTENQVMCDLCKRWFHEDCTDFKGGSWVCKGCNCHEIYFKNLKLFELMEEIVQIEGMNHLDKSAIKFLDSFAFKLSPVLLKLMEEKKNGFEIERYYLRKTLENNLNRIDSIIESENQDEATIMEILYYLIKKELKKEADIKVEELQEISNELSNKNSKFDWGPEKGAIEKRYKKYVEEKLKKMQKDDNREAKLLMSQFVKTLKDTPKVEADLANDVLQIVQALSKSQSWKQIYAKQANEASADRLIEFFYDSKLGNQEATEILSNIAFIERAKKQLKINESDFQRISTQVYYNLDGKKSKLLRQLYLKQLGDLKIVRTYEERKKLLSEEERKYLTVVDTNKRQEIKRVIVEQGLLISSNSPLVHEEIDYVEFEILKRRHFKKFREPNPFQLEEAINSLNRLLQVNTKVGLLAEDEVVALLQQKAKYIFYLNLLSYHSRLKGFSEIYDPKYEIEEENQPEVPEGEQQRKVVKPIPIETIVGKIILKWDCRFIESVYFALEQLYILAKSKSIFPDEQLQKITTFAETILEYLSNRILGDLKLKVALLEKMVKIINYTRMNEKYCYFENLWENYEDWKRELEEKFIDVEKVLEDKARTTELLAVIEQKKKQAEELDFDITSELKKLHVLKNWAILSMKLYTLPKATITAISNTKSLMSKISYPRNELRAQVERLDEEGQILNKRISRFLQRTKVTDMEIYEEIKFVSSKMTIEEAVELTEHLDATELDVEVELEELIELIKCFRNLPKGLPGIAQSAENSAELLAIKRKIMESPFRYEPLEDFNVLLHRIYELKCKEEGEEPVFNRKDYFRYLHYGGVTGANLFAQTLNLHKVYKEIEVAERQLSNAKPKPELLLPLDGRRIKSQLRDSPVERTKVQKWYLASQKLRDKYKMLRSSRAQIQKFISLEVQLVRLPINNRQIMQQIAKIKKDLDDLTVKVSVIMEDMSSLDTNNTLLESPYTSDLVFKYRLVGARKEELDKFESIYNKNKEIMDFSRNLTIQNYKAFSKCCEQSAQLMRNQQVYSIREAAFLKMKEVFLESTEPMIELAHTLYTEGGVLCRYPSRANNILPIMIEINTKFNKWPQEQLNQDGEDEDDEENSDQISDDDEMDDDEIDEDDEDMGLFDEDQDYGDEDDDLEVPKKKKPNNNQVVDLADDDD